MQKTLKLLVFFLALMATTAVQAGEKPTKKADKAPFKAIDVSYRNDTVTLAATLTLPRGVKRAPAVVFLSGTGQQDRDGTMGGHTMFADLAAFLSSHGVAVLRADDRGVGGSTGTYDQATTEDFGNDALAAVRLLRQRSDIDTARIGLIGHSEGGAAMAIAAAKSSDVKFLISLSGLCDTGLHSLIEQNAAVTRSYPLPDYDVRRYDALNDLMFRLVYKYADSDSLEQKMWEAYDAWHRVDSIYFSTLGVEFDHFRYPIYMYVMQATTPWYRFFVRYDPARYLQQVRVPVLALNGDRDVWVNADTNLHNWQTLLPEGADIETVRLPGLNHLLLPCETGAPNEVIPADVAMPQAVYDAILSWLQRKGNSIR